MVQKTVMLQLGFNKNTRKTHQNTVYYIYKTYKKVKYAKLQQTGPWQHRLEDDLDNNSFDAHFQSLLGCVTTSSLHTDNWMYDCMDTALVKVMTVERFPCRLTDISFSIQTLQRWQIALKLNVELSFSSSGSEEMGLLVVSCLP